MMTSAMSWISPDAMHALGWALVHFLWQGAAIAAIAAVAMAFSRRSSTRYAIGVAALTLMFVAPIVMFVSGLQRSGAADTGMPAPLAAAARVIARGKTAAGGAIHASFNPASSDNFLWLIEAWLLGVTLLSLRSAGGFLLLARKRRSRSVVLSPQVLEICQTLQRRLGVRRAIHYCECKWLQAPAVIGWFRPIVFLPAAALTGLSEEQLRSVIAHELAHVQRLDPFVNVFQIFVETLLFYHPAVWWLNKKIRAEREHCCDEIAVSVCGNPVEYARALTLMEEWRSAPVLAMAANGGPLKERIFRVLGLKTLGAETRGLGLTGSVLCLASALAAGNVLVTMTHPAIAHAELIRAGLIHAKADFQTLPSVASAATSAQQSTPAAVANPKPSPAHRPASDEPASSYIDGMKAAGLGDLTIDQLIALKIQGVTPEYVREIHELGLHPDVDGLVGFKVQGITPEYIKEMRALGFTPDADQFVGLKVQGVTPEYVHEMKEVGISADADQIIGLKVQGVTAEYVRELRALGLKVDGDDVVGMKVQGVTPEYVKGLKEQGLSPDANDIVGMRVQGVTPEYIRDIRALGFSPSADELVGMKVQGVTPEFIKALQSAGFKPSIDDIVGAKVQGVTPEFIEQVRKHGFKDLTIEKLIELRRLGILESKADI
jgi:beta-lactamase regulating signal transducer with metallopeptidase domain